jgi:hypothetical protein
VTLVVAWVVFPLVLAAVTLGCGLVLEAVAGARLPFALLLPAGLASVVVVMGLATMTDATAELAVPLAVALGAAGLALGAAGLRARIESWAIGVFVATYAIYAAPIVASGEATFAGYVKLDDTATFLGTLDYVLGRGTEVSGLMPSSYEAMLSINLGDGYPVGSLLPLGVTRLVGLDPAWTWQPYLAFLAALLGLVLYELVGDLVRGSGLRALAAVAASGSALLYGYALWGGVKELFAAAVLALVVATLPLAWGASPRAAVVPAVAAAALLDGLSAAGAIWLVPPVVAVAVVAWRTRAPRIAVAAIVLGLALSLPALRGARTFLDNATAVARGTDDMGNLLGPLSPWQLVGIWPSADFRVEPEPHRATIVLVGVALVAAAVGATVAYHRRAWRLLLLLVTAVAGAVVFLLTSGPWIEAKALAIASPVVLCVALAGGAVLMESGRRVEGALALAAIVGGVAWSNVLAAGDPRLAPRAQLAELEAIGKRYAGDAPALMTEYQPYGVRHFLRRLDPEGASELRRRPVPLRDGRLLGKGETAPIDAFAPDAVLVYRTLVLLRAGPGGTPRAPFELVERGRYYDVWQRP